MNTNSDRAGGGVEFGDRCMFIAGRWVDAYSGSTSVSVSPSDGSELARFPVGGREDARRALDAAYAAEDSLSRLSVFERSALCERVADAAESRVERLANAISSEIGKPFSTEGLWEARAFPSFFRQAAADIVRLNGETYPSRSSNKRMLSFHRSRGLYAIITPWNFPYNIPSEYLSAALAAGNPVVWVPSPSASLCATVLAECLAEADLPVGAFNLVLGPGSVVGDEIVGDPRTRGVGFTGSPATGRQVAIRAAGKAQLLELGGNGPVIVLDDADLDAAAAGIAYSAYFNAGQACSATERVLVQRSVHEALRARLEEESSKVIVGDPFDGTTTMGPLHLEVVASKMDAHIADATRRGAEIVVGGTRIAGLATDLYYSPTLLDNVTPEMLVNNEESFGPIIPMIPFDSDADALRVSNSVPLGLISSVYTSNLKRAFVFGRELNSGIVNINETPDYWETQVPYGGAAGTDSGLGRLGGPSTLREMLDTRSMVIDLGDGRSEAL